MSNSFTLCGVLETYFSHIPARISCGGAASEEDFLAEAWREEDLDAADVLVRLVEEEVDVVEAMLPRVELGEACWLWRLGAIFSCIKVKRQGPEGEGRKGLGE